LDPKAQKESQITTALKNLISRMKLQSRDFVDLDVRIYPAPAAGGPYVIEMSKGRFSRRVSVDPRTLQSLQIGHADAHLTRELRGAMLAIAKRARERER
jgi:hypothetical protein